jgi:hypothetical protein
VKDGWVHDAEISWQTCGAYALWYQMSEASCAEILESIFDENFLVGREVEKGEKRDENG